jgi:hypothetical protein
MYAQISVWDFDLRQKITTVERKEASFLPPHLISFTKLIGGKNLDIWIDRDNQDLPTYQGTNKKKGGIKPSPPHQANF